MIGTVGTRLGLALFVAGLLALAPSSAPAQGSPPDASREEATAYKAWYDVNAAQDLPKAVELARAYLGKYPTGRYAEYLKGWLPQVRAHLFSEAVKAKDFPEMIRLGREALGDDPDDLFFLYWLAVGIRSAESWAPPVRSAHAAAVAEFTRRAIPLIEAGRLPTGVEPGRWNPKATLGYLYQTLGMLEETDGHWDEAAAYAAKAGAADPANPAYAFDCGRMHQATYLAAVRDFQAVPEAERAVTPLAPEAQSVLDRVDREADRVIDCWTRFMALTATNSPYAEARPGVEKALAELYPYRHPDAPGGLAALIEQQRRAAEAAPAAPELAKPTP